MSNPTAARAEWDNLKPGQRNCLLWPDFLEWGNVENREIKREELTDELGIISVVVQDPRNKVCFNIIKQIIEGKPSSGKVNPFEWIVAVDGKSTTKVKGSDELVNMIKNGKDKVQMSIRKAIDPLKNIRAWRKEEVKLELNLERNSKDFGFRLAHFYSKAKKEEDRILIFEVNSESQEKTIKSGKSLIRGDELIAVDDTDVKGKKLKEIYDLIKKHSNPTLSIRKILTKKEFEEKLRRTATKQPDKIYWNQLHKVTRSVQKANEPSLGFILSSGESSTSGETFHVISHISDHSPASHADLSVGDRLMSVNGVSLGNDEKKAVEELIKNQCVYGELRLELWPPEGLKTHQSKRHSLRRRSLRKISNEDSMESESSSKRETRRRSSSSMQAQSNTETMSSEESSDQVESIPKHTDGKKQLILKKKQFPHIHEQENPAYYSSGVEDETVHIRSKAKKLPADKVLNPVNMKSSPLDEDKSERNRRRSSEKMLLQSSAESTSEAINSEDSDQRQHSTCIETGRKMFPTSGGTDNPVSKNMKKGNDESYSSGLNDADLCKKCNQNQVPKLSENKLLWPINKVEYSSREEICGRLDIDNSIHSNKKFASFLGFSPEMINRISQEFGQKSGRGAASRFLTIWSCENKESNVGGIRKICQSEEFKREDVVRLIDEWTMKNVCFGCGRLLPRK